MRLNLERARPSIADVDNSRILPRPLQHSLAACGQPLQMHARGFVRTVLTPHHAEDAEFGERGLAFSEKLLDLFVFVGSQAVLPEGLRRKSRSQGSGHGEALLSHFRGRVGRELWGCHEKIPGHKLPLKSIRGLPSGKISPR